MHDPEPDVGIAGLPTGIACALVELIVDVPAENAVADGRAATGFGELIQRHGLAAHHAVDIGNGRAEIAEAAARLGVAAGRFNMFDRFASFGLVYSGLLPGRDGDTAGLAVAVAGTSDGFRATSPATGTEVAIELTYRFALTDWLALQPDLQYIVSPGTDPALSNALTLGIRAELGVSF